MDFHLDAILGTLLIISVIFIAAVFICGIKYESYDLSTKK